MTDAQQIMARLGTGPAMSQQVLNTLGAGFGAAFNMTGTMNPANLAQYNAPGNKHAWLDRTYSPAEMDKLQQQWGQAQIDDFDFSRLRETNPLAYLGYQASRQKGQGISEFQTPINATGVTYLENVTNKKADDYDLNVAILKQAGVDPNHALGRILLGPQFASGRDTYTMEHELMHRGAMELMKKKDQFPEWRDRNTDPNKLDVQILYDDQENLIHTWEFMHGLDKLHEDEAMPAKEYLKENAPEDIEPQNQEWNNTYLDRMQRAARMFIQ